jgi:hypothetical protein
MEIKVLGTGCYKCVELEMLLASVLAELKLTDTPVTRVDDPVQIRHHISLDDVPGLLIDRRLVSQGRLPSRDELREWLRQTVAVAA